MAVDTVFTKNTMDTVWSFAELKHDNVLICANVNEHVNS